MTNQKKARVYIEINEDANRTRWKNIPVDEAIEKLKEYKLTNQ